MPHPVGIDQKKSNWTISLPNSKAHNYHPRRRAHLAFQLAQFPPTSGDEFFKSILNIAQSTLVTPPKCASHGASPSSPWLVKVKAISSKLKGQRHSSRIMHSPRRQPATARSGVYSNEHFHICVAVWFMSKKLKGKPPDKSLDHPPAKGSVDSGVVAPADSVRIQSCPFS